jgi:cold shock CspA family protein
MNRKCFGEIVKLKDSYGFVLDNEGNYRWFHAKYVKGVTFEELNVGDNIEFTPFVGPRGRRAEDVKRIRRTRSASVGA